MQVSDMIILDGFNWFWIPLELHFAWTKDPSQLLTDRVFYQGFLGLLLKIERSPKRRGVGVGLYQGRIQGR